MGLLGYYVDPKQEIETEITHPMNENSINFGDEIITKIVDFFKDPMGKILIGVLMIAVGYWTYKHPDNLSKHFRPYY